MMSVKEVMEYLESVPIEEIITILDIDKYDLIYAFQDDIKYDLDRISKSIEYKG